MKKLLTLGIIFNLSSAQIETESNTPLPGAYHQTHNHYSIHAAMIPQEKSRSVKESLTDGFFEGLKMGTAQLTGLIFIASLKEGLPYVIKYFRGSKPETGLEPGQEIILRTNLLMNLDKVLEKLKNCDESDKENLEFQIEKIKEVLNQLG